MFPHYKKTYLHRQKNIKVPVNSVISDADYKINRHFRKNY